MNEKLYSTIELIMSLCFMALGITVMSRSNLFEGYVQYVMIGFVVFKVALLVTRAITYKLNMPFMFVQAGFNLAIIVCLFVFKQANALSFVISTSCFVDLGANLFQSFFFKKSHNEFLRTSFFGIENAIYLILTFVLIFNKDSDLLATGVLFGAIILYKGVAVCLGNNYVRAIIDKSDFGRAVRNVHGLDIFFGLLIIVLMASCVFPYLEPTVFSNYEDALWYCFTLITTIGTGEFVAHTTLGRILSVIIGCYGIVIVSVITSAFIVYLGKAQRKAEKDKAKFDKEDEAMAMNVAGNAPADYSMKKDAKENESVVKTPKVRGGAESKHADKERRATAKTSKPAKKKTDVSSKEKGQGKK